MKVETDSQAAQVLFDMSPEDFDILARQVIKVDRRFKGKTINEVKKLLIEYMKKHRKG